MPDMERSLAYIRAEGSLPVSKTRVVSPYIPLANPADRDCQQPELDSKEDQNSVGPCPISQAKIQGLKDEVDSWLQPGEPGHDIFSDKSLNICILDGFLLYCREMETVMPLIDLKLFLLVSRAKATQRRKARDGYVTLEGFWKDPPGYVDQIVWPNYVKAHKWLFEGDDVEGQLRRDRLSESGIHAQLDKGIDIDIEETLDWAVHVIMQELGRIAGDVGGRST